MPQKQALIILTVIIALAAGFIGFYAYPRPVPVNQPGRPCVLTCPNGHTTASTWGKVFALPDVARRMGDDGLYQVQCPTCRAWAKVRDPTPPAP